MGSERLSRVELYDTQFSKAYPADWENRVLDEYMFSKGKLLDVGCGTGRHVIQFVQKGFEVVGVDKDLEFIEAAKTKLKRKQLNADLIRADAKKLPLTNHDFDYVLSMGSVLGDEGINSRDRKNIIGEMKRTCKAKGTIIIEIIHRYWKPKDLLKWLWNYVATTMQKLCRKQIEYGDYSEVFHINTQEHKFTFHAFTTGEVKKLMLSHGLLPKIEKRGRLFHDWFFVISSRAI